MGYHPSEGLRHWRKVKLSVPYLSREAYFTRQSLASRPKGASRSAQAEHLVQPPRFCLSTKARGLLACPIGFEPTVSRVGVLCVIQLRYGQRFLNILFCGLFIIPYFFCDCKSFLTKTFALFAHNTKREVNRCAFLHIRGGA